MTKGVFREICIQYQGRSYNVVPSNKLLRRIDAELSPQSLFGVLSGLNGTNVPLPAIALIIQQLLNSAGGSFTEDDILIDLLEDAKENNGDGIKPLVEAIALCLTPEGVSPKNSASPSAQGGAKEGSTQGKKRSRQ